MLVEKYRPKSFDEIVGQDEIIQNVKNAISRPEKPHLLFVGPPGCGKTSTANCVARAIFGERWRQHYTELNASDERGIDTVRDKIKRLSKIKGQRIIFLDEVDNMTADAQQALRRIMETTRSTMFILSGNREWKIIAPIKSRCVIFRFKRLSDRAVLRRLLEVCKAEGITITKDAREGFVELVKGAKGDLRKALNTLEALVNDGKQITAKEVIALQRPKIAKTALLRALDGDFEGAKEMLEDAYINANFDGGAIIDEFYEALSEVKDREVRIRLYARLAEADRACKIGANPLIQLVGFLSYVWVAPHLPKGCPAKEGAA